MYKAMTFGYTVELPMEIRSDKMLKGSGVEEWKEGTVMSEIDSRKEATPNEQSEDQKREVFNDDPETGQEVIDEVHEAARAGYAVEIR
jgi:hypothetical protein